MRPLPLVLSILLSSTALADDYARVLAPVVLQYPVQGAFGSQWVTELSIHNSATHSVMLDPAFCSSLISPCPRDPMPPSTAVRFGALTGLELSMSIGPSNGFIYIPTEAVDAIHLSLIVKDVSRSDETFGTQLPLVPESDFRLTKISLLNIPAQPPFRGTLRIYHGARVPTTVRVRVFSMESTDAIVDRNVDLSPGGSGPAARPYVPGYAEMGDLLSIARERGIEIVRVEIDPTNVSVWAFLSVTNNTTQQVTIVTPQRPL